MSTSTVRVAACLVAGALAAIGIEPLAIAGARGAGAGAKSVRASPPAIAAAPSALPGAPERSAARGEREADARPPAAARAGSTADTMAVRAVIRSTLYDALDVGAATLPPGARAELAWRMADVLKYRVDLSRELENGTVLTVLFLRSMATDGTTRIGSVLAARLDAPRSPIEAIRFGGAGAPAEYFDQHGRSLRAAFLRAPLAFRRISSVFGPRMHPILGDWREHRGTDYAAASGTPVHSVGDGTVAFLGSRRGYGNLVDIRHDNGFMSRYGHLRGFAGGIAPGARVRIGQTVGYVGMTGLATGPHLHFEMLVGGVPRDPGAALLGMAGKRLALAERPAFDSTRAALLATLERRTGR